MNDLAFLTWVRGPSLDYAIGIFLLGLIWRLIEVFSLGRKHDLAVPRHRPGASGWHTVFRRSLPQVATLNHNPSTYVSYIGGYVFHFGFFAVLLLSAPHIQLFKSLLGLSWPGLPSRLVDFIAVLTIIAMVVVLIDRFTKKVKRFLSTFKDYFAWTLTFLPVLTGWMAVQHLFLPYTRMLAIHILCVEIFLVFFPFTKLLHGATTFGARWFNGAANGRKGVPV
jgi:nitrate reductase gamma subunit